MTIETGSIAFVGYNADGRNNIAFVVLEDIEAGTVITFTDNEWNGSEFNSGEAVWTWTAGSDIVAGTTITMDGLAAGQTATSNYGTVAFLDESQRLLGTSNEVVYAFTGDISAPATFLSAIANDRFTYGPLDNTGLVEGVNAIYLYPIDSDADVAAYNGPRSGLGSFAEYRALINDPANWITQDGGGDQSADGIAPDAPFAPGGFDIGDPDLQIVEFAASSLEVTQTEGDSGETLYTFTVERNGPTTGAVDFSGVISANGTTYGNDFGGEVPMNFSGSFADGEASTVVTVAVTGDTDFELDSGFVLTLTNVANNTGAPTLLGQDLMATGTIVNDDVQSLKIAFTGYSAEGTDDMAFVALTDIETGTVINFTNKDWTGSDFVDGNGDGTWSWTASSDIAAGTIVTMNGINSETPASNLGTVEVSDTDDFRTDTSLTFYAYTGAPEQPDAFLAGIVFTGEQYVDIRLEIMAEGTGLVPGVDAVGVAAPGRDNVAVAAYTGPRYGQSSIEDYMVHINDRANWTVDADTRNVDDSADAETPDLPFSTQAFTDDPAAQVVEFAAGSSGISQVEGSDCGEIAYTFTIERTGGTDGDISFTAIVPFGNIIGGVNAQDFGSSGTVINGTIPDGETSTEVTVTVNSDTTYEQDEFFSLKLISASNSNGGTVVVGVNDAIRGDIENDDEMPLTVHAGETVSRPIILNEDDHFVVEEGGALSVTQSEIALLWDDQGSNVIIDNYGLIENTDPSQSVIESEDDTGNSLTINNHATGVIRGEVDLQNGLPGTTFTLNNAGLIEVMGRLDFRNVAEAPGTVIVNNLAGGQIIQLEGGSNDLIRPGDNAVINNWGTIKTEDGYLGTSDAVDFKDGEGYVTNYAGGLIEGVRHAVTGDVRVTILNEAGGTMVGRNGGAVNIDNDATEDERVFVTNYGRMEGRSAHQSDSDGDAVDIDGLLTLDNYGFIGGMGHNGYHDGEPNISEGLAIGGGDIRNYEGGEIYGYGRAIEIDDSSNSNALGASSIFNAGLIKGDGNGPTDVTPEEYDLFTERITGGEAVNIVGDLGDTLANTETGQIIGGVKMGGGDDVLTNSGAMTSTGGSAIDMGDGNDTVTIEKGGKVLGQVLLGDGDDQFSALDGKVDVDGGAGNDTIDTGDGDDVLNGGEGDDTLFGGAGNDTYVFNTGDGVDTILETSGYDIIELGAGVSLDDLVFVQDGNDLEIQIASGFIITDFYSGDANKVVEQITFEDGTTFDLTSLLNNPSIIRLGDAPDRLPRTDRDAWINAWSDDGVTITHKSDFSNDAEAWSDVVLSGNGGRVLAGGDIVSGDLGVSGTTQTDTGAYLQEIDGTEALKFELAADATKVTLDLTRFYFNDDGNGNSESIRLQAFDENGNLVEERVAFAENASGESTISFEVESGFRDLTVSSGAYENDQFVFGSLADGNGNSIEGGSKSEFMIEAIEFEFGVAQAAVQPNEEMENFSPTFLESDSSSTSSDDSISMLGQHDGIVGEFLY